MTNIIVKRSNLINALVALTVVVSVVGCSSSSGAIGSWRDSIITVEGIFARESCDASEFSVCNTGFDDSPRMYPLLIDIDTSDLKGSYTERVVYAPMYGRLIDSLSVAGIGFQFPWHVDSMLGYASRMTKEIRVSATQGVIDDVHRLIERNDLHVTFDGFYSYDLLKIRMRCYPVRKYEFAIFDFAPHDPRPGVFEEVECRLMQIVEIVHIEPVSR